MSFLAISISNNDLINFIYKWIFGSDKDSVLFKEIFGKNIGINPILTG